MKKITLWSDGFDGATLVGNITLTKYNNKTNDFELVLQKDCLELVEPTTLVFAEPNENKPWEWLKDFPIQELDIDNITIKPVWKPNRYGKHADTNEFQNVSINDDEIRIVVNAGGTEREVFDRYNPYESETSDTKQILDYDDQFKSHNTNITENTIVDENQLFDIFMGG